MRVIDPGHAYALRDLDGEAETVLRFVKRVGPEYPGNAGAHPGPTTQEVLRALIDRTIFVDSQQPHHQNAVAIRDMRSALAALEARASERHGVPCRWGPAEIETMPTCPTCGHIWCKHTEGGDS